MSTLVVDADLWIVSNWRKEQFVVEQQSEYVVASNGQN